MTNSGITHGTGTTGTTVDETLWKQDHTYDPAASTYPMRFVWKDNPSTALLLTDQTANIGWTDLDLTSYTSANAKAVLLMLVINGIDVAAKDYIIQVRKNGITGSTSPTLTVNADEAHVADSFSITPILGLDSGQVMEYMIYIQSGGQADIAIFVLGYFE